MKLEISSTEIKPTVQKLFPGGPVKLKAVANEKMELIINGTKITGAELVNGRKITLKKLGKDLVLEADGEPFAQIEEFYDTPGVSLDGQGWQFSEGEYLQIADQGLVPVGGEQAGGLLPAAPALALAPLGLGGAGLGLAAATVTAVAAAAGNTDAPSDNPGPASALLASVRIAGKITAGPVKEGEDLVVQFFNAAGQKVGVDVAVNDDGSFSTTLANQVNGQVLVAKLVDRNQSLGNFDDESTGALQSFTTSLMVAFTVNAPQLNIAINPLTTIAAMKAGATASDLGVNTVNLTLTSVQQWNGFMSKLVGLEGDVSAIPVVPTNSQEFTGQAKTAGEKLGVLLASMSGMSRENKSQKETIQQLVDAMGADGNMSEKGVEKLFEGALITPNVKGTARMEELLTLALANTNAGAKLASLIAQASVDLDGNNVSALSAAKFTASQIAQLRASRMARTASSWMELLRSLAWASGPGRWWSWRRTRRAKRTCTRMAKAKEGTGGLPRPSSGSRSPTH